jgi:hypothetical protein
MRRKTILMGFALLLLLAGLGAGLAALVRYEPEFYRAANEPPGSKRKQRSQQFCTDAIGLYNDLVSENFEPGSEDWQHTFAAEKLNCYFNEDFLAVGIFQMPKDIQEPRFAVDQDRLRIGFRYGSGRWSTIVSIDLRLWLVPKESNVIALEVLSLRAGALPFMPQSVLDNISELLRRCKIDVSPWYRHQGKPVALLRFQSGRSSTTARLRAIELRPGAVVIAGRSPRPPLPAREPQQAAAAADAGDKAAPQH